MAQVLHVVWRDGTHDTVIDDHARDGWPSWRADSRALAYIGAAREPLVYDVANGSRHVITWPIARSPATHLAYAPRGGELAIGTETAALLVGRRDEVVWRGQTQDVNWLGGRLAVSERLPPSKRSRTHFYTTRTQLFTITSSGAMPSRTIRLPAPMWAAHGRTFAIERGTSVYAGPIGSLHRVFRFALKPNPQGCACVYIPMGDRDISLG
jgi:hypothetical protein